MMRSRYKIEAEKELSLKELELKAETQAQAITSVASDPTTPVGGYMSLLICDPKNNLHHQYIKYLTLQNYETTATKKMTANINF